MGLAGGLASNGYLSNHNYDYDLQQPGVLAGAGRGWAAVTLTASQAYFMRFVTSRTLNVTLISFVLSGTAGANDNCDVGIYTGAGGFVASAGSTAGKLNVTGRVQTVPLVCTIPPGVYYAAFAVSTIGGTAAQIQGTSIVSAFNAQLFGASAPQVEMGVATSAFPLSTTAMPAFTSITNALVLGVRES